MADWSLPNFQALLSVQPKALPANGQVTTTEIDLHAIGGAFKAEVFGCDCSEGPRSGLSQAEMEAAWRENGAL